MGRVIEVQIEGLPQLRTLFETAPDRVKSESTRALRFAGVLIQRYARMEAPVDKGQLRASIAIRFLGNAVIIEPKAKYAYYVHEGTGLYGPHKQRIVPTTKKAMAWGDGEFFARSTKGQHANPFMVRAVERAQPEVNAAFRQAIANVMRAA